MRLPHVRGEESTKHALVVPLLQVLGYDVFDPREVQPEYVADFAKKKSSGQMEKIDYVVFLNSQPALFIECKSTDAKLEDHDGQLARYFNATPGVKIAILTNGVQFKAFCDLRQPNMMDPTPWLDVDLLNLKPAEFDALKRFRKVDFSPESLIALAEEMVYYNAMVSMITGQLRDPSESFVRFVASELPGLPRVTAKIVDRLRPILQKAIQSAIVEHVARSFAPIMSEPPEEPRPASAVPAQAESAPQGDAREGVVTTAEEIQAYQLIRSWILEVHPGASVAYKDGKTYFTINMANVRKWFVRLQIQKAPYWVALRHLTPDQLGHMAPGMDHLDPSAFGDSRVTLRRIEDLARLRSGFLEAYSREAERRSDSDDAQ